MTMSENEIVRNFKEAKKKREQIGILAELNQCSQEQIREILLRNGISEAELPKKPGKSRKAEPEVFQQQIKKNHAKAEEFRSGKAEPEEMIPTMPVTTKEVKPEIPFTVRYLCINRIRAIDEVMAKLMEERMELEDFIGEWILNEKV